MRKGFNTAPSPLPPLTVTVLTDLISKFCGSIVIELTIPLTTGWINAVVPAPAVNVVEGPVREIDGILRTS